MKKFLADDFLLDSPTAEKLYFDVARDLPIIDYHNHLSPADIASDRVFKNITEAWLENDHYKWRAMRANGVHEEFITSAYTDPRSKFQKWAETVPMTLRNPLYHWTHLELRRYFEIHDLLDPLTAEKIYTETGQCLASPGFSTRSLMRKMNVELICTTDDPLDDLQHHVAMETDPRLRVLPTFRPDRLYAVERSGYTGILEELGAKAGFEINSFDTLLEAAWERIEYFDSRGCRLADHGLECMYDVDYSQQKANKILKDLLNGKSLAEDEIRIFKMTVLLDLSRKYCDKSWVQQFHLGAVRDVNSVLVDRLGKDAGVDSIGDHSQVPGMARFLRELNRTDELARTVIYNLNPRDNAAFAAMAGNFNDGTVPGKMQYGAAWWFLDQKEGILRQLNDLSNMGLLSRFIGMLTDSRSFLSFPRHEYFRRLLCNLLGSEVEHGELPNDIGLISDLVRKVCYENAKDYFGFGANGDQ